MLISWNWLKQYVSLDMSVDELARRLTMAGLNHEETREAAGDLVLDLEVTSNRPDCLGHLGVARETAVLFDKGLEMPPASPRPGTGKASELTSVQIDCPDLCPRYIARVIRGVKIGPSPDWMQRRLAAVGVTAISNVVDVTNYVLLECGQPLHAFDYDKLGENRIVVRRAQPGETIVAIDQRRYELPAETCVIADAARPVAIGGVMGGFDTEVGDGTADLLIEAAEFDPVSIRNTARSLNLHSESSYRFERGVDPAGVDWASRRCCELILELAGGELAEGSADVGDDPPPREPIVLRYAQLRRILGIEIEPAEARRILEKLGLLLLDGGPDRIELRPPTWRRDLTREIDLVEEVGRIHGYEAVPEDEPISVAVSAPTRRERVQRRVQDFMAAAGFCEAVTFSFVDERLLETYSPWSDATALAVDHSSRRHERFLRKSLLPSLLASRRYNETRGNEDAELFELARVYLPGEPGALPEEPTMLAAVGGGSLAELKGVFEELTAALGSEDALEARPAEGNFFATGRAAELLLAGKTLGYLGEISEATAERFDLRGTCTAAELCLDVLEPLARLIPTYTPLAQFPSNDRDLNLVLDESVTWQQLSDVVRPAAGPQLEELTFRDIYRGKQVPPGKKSVHFSLSYRAADRTLTNEEVDRYQAAILEACGKKLRAVLRT